MTSRPTVFVTGGTGFVGSRLLVALEQRGVPTLALHRSGSTRRAPGAGTWRGLQPVRGDLLDVESYGEALRAADTVVHLAALTGRASEAEHFRVNARGTEALLEQCRRVGVKKILFVSSIAAKFPDTSRYAYARAKARAEAAVRGSGVRYTILRPTIVLGPGSPILAALEKLAALPVMPVFGDGRTLVQPIYVDDLVAFIVAVLEQDRFDDETLEVGGPAPLPIEELLLEIRAARDRGHARRGRPVHIPLGLLFSCVAAAHHLGVGWLLPFDGGGLSSFRFDGTAESNSLHARRRASLRDVREMLALSRAT